MKYIHNQFPSATSLKLKFFNAYVWPHLHMMSTVYCLFSKTTQNRVSGFYRRCLRLIHRLFQCPTLDLHNQFRLPTLEKKFQASVTKRIKKIHRHEPSLIDYYLQYKHVKDELNKHYRVKSFIKNLPVGRPNKRILSLIDSNGISFLDKLFLFSSQSEV